MFITFEGIEGAGKTTIAQKLASFLESLGHDVVLTREPGDNSLGRSLRPLLLDARNSMLAPGAELYLFLADRAQHLAEVIFPALEAGSTVICDRYSDSTIAYQGYGRGMDIENLKLLNSLVSNDFQPKITFLLDLPVEIGLARAGARNRCQGTVVSEGRFDSESLKFHGRVKNGYLALARENPDRIVVVDAAEDTEHVVEHCLQAMQKLAI